MLGNYIEGGSVFIHFHLFLLKMHLIYYFKRDKLFIVTSTDSAKNRVENNK